MLVKHKKKKIIFLKYPKEYLFSLLNSRLQKEVIVSSSKYEVKEKRNFYLLNIKLQKILLLLLLKCKPEILIVQ